MNNRDKWSLILSNKRFRIQSAQSETDGRNPFENDYGRLISSSPIRRLQDKTQVFPLEQSDFTRTRLTHSLEVSYIASSLGQSIEKFLIDNGEIEVEKTGYLSSLLRVSGLIHDLGNPPFGHFGEDALRHFFLDYFNHKENNDIGLTDKEIADFVNFDGNVQTLRILAKLYYFGDEHGYNLTYSTLSSAIKYPADSLNGNKGKKAERISEKKFGYFCTEEEIYKKLDEYLQLNGNRNPVVYLMEAADDIAYSAADIEDGMKLGIIDYNKILEIFENNLKENKEKLMEELTELNRKYTYGTGDDQSLVIQKFRISTQRLMITAVIECFKQNYDQIMQGNFNGELIKKSSAADVRAAYEKLQRIVFDSKSIVKKELAGWEAIYGLLSIFVEASESENFKEDGGNNKESRLFKLLSSSHRYVYSSIEKYPNEKYKRLQLIVDYISGMTDSYAINLFQELKGIKL
mgnify:CR=1 FL=1